MRRYSREWGGANGANYMARIEHLTNLNFGRYSRHVNQSGACSNSDVIRIGGRKSETTMEDKLIVVVCGYLELYIHVHTFTKTGIHFAMRLELPGRSPSHDAYLHLLCSEFHTWMKWVNSKCSSVQLRANSAIYWLHSRLEWTHLKTILRRYWAFDIFILYNYIIYRGRGQEEQKWSVHPKCIRIKFNTIMSLFKCPLIPFQTIRLSLYRGTEKGDI